MENVTRSPLSWPANKPRTPDHLRARSPFGRDYRVSPLTVDRGRRDIQHELELMGVRDYVLSTNIALRLDGEPRSGQPEPKDPGVALYFTLKGHKTPTVLACDKWASVAENMRAIVKHLDALRGIERWGVATAEQMFLGNAALPAPGKHSARSWQSVLNFAGAIGDITLDEVNSRYRELARLANGDDVALRELNVARDEARRELGA